MKLISIRTISLKAFSEWLKKEIRSSGSVAKKFFFFPLNHTSSPPFLPPYRKTLKGVLIRERVIELCFKSFRYEATLYILTRRIRRVHECSRVKKVGVGKRRKIWRYGRGERGYKEIWNGLRWSAFINPCTRPERILCHETQEKGASPPFFPGKEEMKRFVHRSILVKRIFPLGFLRGKHFAFLNSHCEKMVITTFPNLLCYIYIQSPWIIISAPL